MSNNKTNDHASEFVLYLIKFEFLFDFTCQPATYSHFLRIY
jgi:hypothetical protein